MGYGRKIEMAFDKVSGEVHCADDIFATYQDAYKVRKNYHEDKYDFSCCECGQKLEISTSKNNLVHFKHAKGTKPCVLKDSKFSEEDMELIKEFYIIRESARHIELKNKIGKLIEKENGVREVYIDNKVVFDEGNRRRPDVICSYKDIKLVFEIQLSTLPLKYMLGRVNFYKSKGYYLIWVLDNIDLDSQDQMVKDIKYLHPSHNFFSLDENSESFKLMCSYKWAYANEKDTIRYKWKKKSVSLHQLTFKEDGYETYFFDFNYRVSQVEREIKKSLEAQLKYEEELTEEKEKEFVQSIIDKIKEEKLNQGYNYKPIVEDINRLDYKQRFLLNQKLNIKNRKKNPAIHKWLETSDDNDLSFLRFILLCDEIEYDINQKDSTGRSALEAWLNNDKVKYKEYLFRYFSYRGYIINSKDKDVIKVFFNDKVSSELTILFFELSQTIKDSSLRIDLFEQKRLLSIVESIKRREIIGFNFRKDSWVQFANNAISFHPENWRIFEIAFKYYNLWNVLLDLDKKGTFTRKLQDYNRDNRFNDGLKDRFLIAELYPEIGQELFRYTGSGF